MGEQCFVTRALSSGPGYFTHGMAQMLQSRKAHCHTQRYLEASNHIKIILGRKKVAKGSAW